MKRVQDWLIRSVTSTECNPSFFVVVGLLILTWAVIHYWTAVASTALLTIAAVGSVAVLAALAVVAKTLWSWSHDTTQADPEPVPVPVTDSIALRSPAGELEASANAVANAETLFMSPEGEIVQSGPVQG